MIIVCPECSTKFEVNPERIADSGIKVRCARCKQVFLAQKPLPPSSVEPEQAEPTPTETDVAVPLHSELKQTEPPLPLDPEPVGALAPSEVPTPPPTDSFDSPLPFQLPDEPPASEIDDVDFDYDQFQELDADKQLHDETDDEPSFGHEASDSESSKPASVAVATENSNDIFPGKAEMDDATTEPDKSQKSSPLTTLIKFLLLLILAILMIGAVMLYLNGPEHLNQMIRQHLGQQTYDTSQSGEVTLGSVDGRFLTNEQAGELFLIRGEAINNFNQPRSAIQVKGVLYDQHGKPLMQKTVFCGNPISDEDLRTLSFSELEQKMGNQFGKDLSNMRIAPGRSIPFDIVFKDIPQDISEFSVTVSASNPTTP